VLVEEKNLEKLGNLRCGISKDPVPIPCIPGKHNSLTAKNGSVDVAEGISSVLYLAKGCKIMLKSNLWTEMGLVNGAIGTVVDFVYNYGECSPNDSPRVILCNFPSYKGPCLDDCGLKNVIPLPAISKTWKSGNGASCTRIQFPITLAYACTIHKAQGLTLPQVSKHFPFSNMFINMVIF